MLYRVNKAHIFWFPYSSRSCIIFKLNGMAVIPWDLKSLQPCRTTTFHKQFVIARAKVSSKALLDTAPLISTACELQVLSLCQVLFWFSIRFMVSKAPVFQRIRNDSWFVETLPTKLVKFKVESDNHLIKNTHKHSGLVVMSVSLFNWSRVLRSELTMWWFHSNHCFIAHPIHPF